MNKIILFSLSLFFSITISTAQIVDIALQNEFFSFADDVVQSSDGNWVVGGMQGYYPGWPSLRPVVYKLDSSGNILWAYNFSLEIGAVNAVNPLSDGGYIVSGFESGCDYIVPSFVARLDESGALVWRKEGAYGSRRLSKIFCDHIVTSEYENTKIYTLSGDELMTYQQGFAEIFDIEISHDESRIYIVTANELIHFDCPDLETPAVNANSGIQKLVSLPESTGADFAGISENALLLLDGELATEDSLILSSGRIPEDLTFCGDKYVVLTRTTDPHGYYLEFYDENLAFVEEWEVGDRYTEIRGIKCIDGKVGIWGRELFWKGDEIQNYHLLYQLLEEAPELSVDLALQSVTAETATLEQFSDDYCWDGVSVLLKFSGLTAKVWNTGLEPITAFKINFKLDRCAFICSSIGHYEQNFENITLAPGALMDVFLPDFSIEGMVQPSEVDNYEACFWVSVPNKKTDKDHSNDSSCISISTSTEELNSVESAMQLVPNPVREMMEFRFAENIKTYELLIYDQLGRLVFQEAGAEAGKTLEVDFSRYPAGLYYYLFNKNNNVFTGLFVKVE